MRQTLLVVLFLCSCTPVDSMLGTFNATVSGMDMNTSPTSSTSTVSGTGTLAVTADKEHVGYTLTFGQENYLCVVKATRATSTPLQLDVAGGQTCHFGNVTAVTTEGKVTVDKETLNVGTLTVSYTYMYTVGFTFAGNGTRTFTGPRQ